MFHKKFQELLKSIGYKLYHLDYQSVVMEDQSLELPNDLYDVVSLPCTFTSDDKMRQVDCYFGDKMQWGLVRAAFLSNDIQFFKGSILMNRQGDNLTSFEFEQDGILYDLNVGNKDQKKVCCYRTMQILDGKPYLEEISYDGSSLQVSKGFMNEKEVISLKEIEGEGVLQIIKNGSLLDERKISGNLDPYYSAIISTVNPIIDHTNHSLHDCNSSFFQSLLHEYPHFSKFQHLNEESYDADALDDLFHQYPSFLEDEVSSYYEKR